MSVEMFAPAWYYVGDVNEEYQKRIEDLFKPFISNDDNFSDAVGWNCNVQTSISDSVPVGIDLLLNVIPSKFTTLRLVQSM